MNIFFECLQCEADFEFELPELLRDPSLVVCPNCGIKADTRITEGIAASLDEAIGQASRLKRRFAVSFSLESDEFEETNSEDYENEDDDEALWSNEPDEEEEDDDN